MVFIFVLWMFIDFMYDNQELILAMELFQIFEDRFAWSIFTTTSS